MMTGGIDALADLGNAALIADAIDTPAAGASVSHARCPNCAAPLQGNFCANCGQKAHLHRSLAEVGHEFLHGITHFDGKAWTTLPMLLFRPGRLTRDYIMGKRARYIAPVPLFLLVVFLMFFVFSFVHIRTNGPTGAGGAPMTQAEAKTALPGIDRKIAELDAQIAAARAKGDGNAVTAIGLARAAISATRGQVQARAEGEIGDPSELPGAIAREIGGADPSKVKVNLGSESFDLNVRKALKNPDLVLYKIQGKAYKLSFLLVPLSLPWLWLLFAGKRGVRMYDHAIFALYSISFMSLLFVVGSIMLALDIDLGPLWTMLFLAPLVHMFVQLKGAYQLSNLGAAWRTFALSLASIITLALYGALMIVIGLID